uniref:Uncharacterized protein n=1 Tax=Klebsiella pneumoniae TaxID=573 RepID=A0A809SWJ5_KLEPN|nr:hypothetical protein [Klebsiella pneumoniae]
MGLTRETADAQTKSRVSMATRDKKTDDYSREDIHKEWVNRLTSWESTSMICPGLAKARTARKRQ